MKRMILFAAGVCLTAMMATDSVADVRGMNRIAGTVTEPSGEPVAGVSIKATLEGSVAAIEGTSDEKGSWYVAGMPKGEWSVVFTKPGYSGTKARVILPVDMSRVPPIKVVLKKE